MSLRRCVCLALALVLSACGSSSATPFRGASERAAPARGNSRLIVRAELDEYSNRTAWEAIETLRSLWLRSSRGSLAGDRVYARVMIDGVIRGDLNELRGIGANNVEELRFLSPADATIRYGTGYMGGVIEVSIRGT